MIAFRVRPLTAAQRLEVRRADPRRRSTTCAPVGATGREWVAREARPTVTDSGGGAQPVLGRDHRRWSLVNSVNDLGVVDNLGVVDSAQVHGSSTFVISGGREC